MAKPSPQKQVPLHAPQPRLQFAANLDILRALAVSLVLVDHVLDMLEVRHPNWSLRDVAGCAGRLGVLLFFVHTSLVLNFSLERLGTTPWQLFRTFIVRRAFRLYPLSIVCVLLVAVFDVPVAPWGNSVAQHTWGLLLSNLTLTTDLTGSPNILGTLWTLSIELQMYVAMPIVFMMLGPTRSPRAALCLWILAAIVAWLQPSIAERITSIDFAPCFIAGAVAYTLSGWYSKRLPAVLWIPCLLAMLYGFFWVQHAVPGTLANMPLEWLFCLAVGLAIPLFHDSTLKVVNYAAQRIARYSYGIYLFHFIALWVGCTLLNTLPEPLQWAAALATMVAMSVGSYHLLEKPAIDLGVRLTSRPDRHAVAGAAISTRPWSCTDNQLHRRPLSQQEGSRSES